MPHAPSDVPVALPRWLVWVGSVVIVLHLGAVGVRALAAPSGPWQDGLSPPPQFAYSAKGVVEPYLQAVHLVHDYRFPSNRPGQPGVYFEARLKNEAGEEIATLRVPDDPKDPRRANAWVRHRQAILARWLGEDRPVMPPQTEYVAPPGQQVPTTTIWEPGADGQLRLRTVEVNQVPRDRPVMGPSDISLLLAAAYGRHLCRAHGAARVEIVRHHQDPIPPVVMFMDNVPAAAFDKQASNFGEFPR